MIVPKGLEFNGVAISKFVFLFTDDRCWLMKNFSPLCSIVLLENLKNSTVNFIISHPGLSYIFVQEVNQFSFRVLLMTFTKSYYIKSLWSMLSWKISLSSCAVGHTECNTSMH